MPQQDFTGCASVSDRFTREAGRIGPDSYKRGRETNPIWLGLIPQKPWHDEMGLTIKNTIYNRSGLTTPPTWTDIQVSNGADINGCLPPLTVIDNATTLQQYNRQWLALESNPLCLMDIVSSNEPQRAVQGFIDNLMGNAVYVRKERVRSEYERLCNHKVVIAPGLPEDSGGFPLVQPTSPVTGGVLRHFYRRVERDADGTTGVSKMATGDRGQQLFMFVSSGETIENIVKGDDSIRQDFRWSSRVNELLGSWSAARIAWGGFVMCQESFPPRYNWNGADFVRVPEYVASATNIGNELDVSPLWNNAQYEVSYIFHPDVMCSRVPNRNQVFGKVKYGPLNYSLDFRWINEYHKDCNPDKMIGFFRAVGIHASEPIHTIFGYAMLALRCDVALDLAPCASNSGYNSSQSSSGLWSGPESVIQ